MAGMKILWYNKSRAKSRICPTCLRLYDIGDELSDLTDEGFTRKVVLSVRLLREQKLSGFCGSNVLFTAKSRCNCMRNRLAGVLRDGVSRVCTGSVECVGTDWGRDERDELGGAEAGRGRR